MDVKYRRVKSVQLMMEHQNPSYGNIFNRRVSFRIRMWLNDVVGEENGAWYFDPLHSKLFFQIYLSSALQNFEKYYLYR